MSSLCGGVGILTTFFSESEKLFLSFCVSDTVLSVGTARLHSAVPVPASWKVPLKAYGMKYCHVHVYIYTQTRGNGVRALQAP